MAAAKKLTAQQQRDRRAKIMLAVLGCVLLLVVALQAPKLMHSGGGSAAPSPLPTTTAATAAAGLASAPVAIPATAGQLEHFSQFKAKDPFKAGVSAAVAAAPASAPAPKPSAQQAPVQKADATPKTPLTLAVSPTKPAVPVGPRVPAAVLMVNGKKQIVLLDTPFPAKHPLFSLVAVGGKTVWLRLIGGSLANGSQSIKLEHGRKITLVNSTVNLRVVLALVKPTTAPKPAVAAAPTSTAPATTTAATTTPAAPPATTTTTG